MHFTSHYKRLRVRRLKIAVLALIVSLFFIPNFELFKNDEDNIFTVYVNDKQVGILGSLEDVNDCYMTARRNINSNSKELTFIKAELTYTSDKVNFGAINSKKAVIAAMEQVMNESYLDNYIRAYEVKINDYTTILASGEEVTDLLQRAISKFDSSHTYKATLSLDDTRELPVLTPSVITTEEQKAEEEAKETATLLAGFDQDMVDFFGDIEPTGELELTDYQTGMVSMGFKDYIEIVEVYVHPDQITSSDKAVEELLGEVVENDIYVVQPGDTLSGIALKVNIPMEDLIAMNETLEDTRSLIRPKDELIVTVVKPKLTVQRREVLYYEENYTADPIITRNPNWFTTESVVHVQPSDGHRKVVAEVLFDNDTKTETNILAQNVTMEAVAKEIEIGEKIPPTYIKPINGGRLTSNFGPRKAPKKGASTNHKGIDWGTPVGTPVYASCGGTVARAGWLSGYGYCIYINHPDGKQTRYAHLSKVLVSAGQSVSQGQKIALSGNTGNSTGPHLHFEIHVGGKAVNPFNYI